MARPVILCDLQSKSCIHAMRGHARKHSCSIGEGGACSRMHESMHACHVGKGGACRRVHVLMHACMHTASEKTAHAGGCTYVFMHAT
eukprot:363192-Chlamydomonas_euryale.AAC.22